MWWIDFWCTPELFFLLAYGMKLMPRHCIDRHHSLGKYFMTPLRLMTFRFLFFFVAIELIKDHGTQKPKPSHSITSQAAPTRRLWAERHSRGGMAFSRSRRPKPRHVSALRQAKTRFLTFDKSMRTSSIPLRHKVFSLFRSFSKCFHGISNCHAPHCAVPICDLKIVLIAKASEPRSTRGWYPSWLRLYPLTRWASVCLGGKRPGMVNGALGESIGWRRNSNYGFHNEFLRWNI